MNLRKLAGIGSAAAVLPMAGAGVAHASDHDNDDKGYGSTQSSTQGVDAGKATVDNGRDSFEDGLNGENRPHGADGTETEFGQPDSRFVEGPLGGLVNNGPLG